VANFLPYGPAIAEHCILDAGLDPATKLLPPAPAAAAAEGEQQEQEQQQQEVHALRQQGQAQAQLQAALVPALKRLDSWFAALDSGAPAGFITVSVPGEHCVCMCVLGGGMKMSFGRCPTGAGPPELATTAITGAPSLCHWMLEALLALFSSWWLF
jgi:hypothetical protein